MESFTITLTKAELQTLSEGLVEMPYRKSAPLIDTINKQIQTQLAAEQPATEDAPAA